MIVEVGKGFNYKTEIFLFKDVHEEIDSFNYFYDEFVLDGEFQSTVVVENACELGDVCGWQVCFDADEESMYYFLAKSEFFSSKKLEHGDGGLYFFF